MTAVFLLFLAIGAAAVFGLLVAAIRRWTLLPLYLLTILSAIAWDLPGFHLISSVRGVSIFVEDVVVLAALAATVMSPARVLAVTKPFRLILVVVALGLAGALLAGLLQYEVGSTMNEFRAFLYPVGISIWMLNQDWYGLANQKAFRRWAVVTGTVLSLVALTHGVLYGLGRADSFVTSVLTGQTNTGRPLTSDQAMLLGLVGFLSFKDWAGVPSRGTRWAGFVFILVAIACQHRSVWAGLIVGVAVSLVRLRGVALGRLAAGMFAATIVGSIALLSGAADGIIRTLVYSATNTGTLNGRLSSWTQLLDRSIGEGAWTVLFGAPFGAGYDRLEGATIVSYAPHNWYVTVYLRLGIVGLSLFVLLMAVTLAKVARRGKEITAIAVLAAVLVYVAAYSLTLLIAPFVGWCIVASMSAYEPPGGAKTPTRRSAVHLRP